MVSSLLQKLSRGIFDPLDSVSTQQILNVVLELRSIIPNVDTRFTYFQAPVRVEDALGRIFPVPSEYTPGDLEAIIQRRFKIGPGHTQVQSGSFQLLNSSNRAQIISASRTLALRPGMSLTMAILLRELPNTGSGSMCPMPRCMAGSTTAVRGGGRTW